jgi:integrase
VVAGLDLRVQPDGRKFWTVRYRDENGEQRRLKLGEYGPSLMSLAAARQAASNTLLKVRAGRDPQAERKAAKVAAKAAKQAKALAQRDSIEALCSAYIERHARPRKRTWRDDQSKINCEILPAWKGRPVTSITRRDCRVLVQRIAGRQTKGKGVYANRVAALLSRLFRFAADDDLIETNIAAQLPKPGVEIGARPETEQPDKPYDADEIRAIWQATEDLPAAPRALYRLGLVTGQRPGEISGMQWDEINATWWTIPAARTKNRKEHRVYLTGLALAELGNVSRVKDDPRVFVGHRGKRQLSEMNAQVFARVREREKPRHAMRDTVATGLAAAGVSVADIAHVLNHAVGLRVTAGYNAYAYDKERRLALWKWERRLRAILTEKEVESRTVVSIERAR